MKKSDKYIITLKTIVIVLTLILGVLLPNMILKGSIRESYATSSFSSSVNTKLGTVTIKTDAKSFKEGDTIPIEIYTSAKNIISFGGYINYDNTKFDILYADTDIDKLTGWTILDGDEIEGIGRFINIYTSKNDISNSIIATIYLRVIEDIDEETNFEINYFDMVNTKYENIEEDDYLPNISLKLEGNKDIDPDNPSNPDKPDDPENPSQPEEPEVKYTISYNTNTTEEVIGMPENEKKTKGKSYTIFGIEPSIVGYTFEGWNTLADGTGTTYKSGSIYTNDENLTLYAQWKEVPKLQSLYLTSETYKIGNIDITKYQEGDKYISRIEKETMLIDYINNLTTNGEIEVINAKGEKLQDEDYVGTGMTLIVTKGEEKIELKIAVMGDLSGEGAVTAQDYSEINRALLGTNALENEFMIAGDTSEDGKITASDFSDINKMVLKIL